MFERPATGELAILVHINFLQHDSIAELEEFRLLALSANAQIVAQITGARQVPDPKYFVGQGKALEIQQAAEQYKANVILFNHTLSPAQERNLEKLFKCRVVDRTGLILDIFAQRARTFEGKLQVELAQLQHMSTRLVRGWTHLERQKGGIGLRGPGETQLETDRRLIRARIKTIHKRLEKVRQQREQNRQTRLKADMLTVSLVGYTNAGKSTLFNRLTQADVYVANQLFATLDPTLRRVEISNFGEVILADTVGFIRHLPHGLVEAFRATLEETRQADLLLHVIDASDPQRHENIEQVELVLQQIGADKVKTLQVFNKIDLLESINEPHIDRDSENQPNRVWLSAQNGIGIDLLHQAIRELLGKEVVYCCLLIKPNEGRLRAALFNAQAVISEQHDEAGNNRIELRINKQELTKLLEFDEKSLEK